MTGFAPLALTDLVRRWERGWRECRGWATPEQARGGLHSIQDQATRYREIIALHDDETTVRTLGEEAAAATRTTWVTVATTSPDEVAHTLRAAGLKPRDTPEYLMTRTLAAHPTRTPAVPYRVTTTTTGAVLKAEVHDGEAVAASGQASVVDGHAVPDKIETHPDHRRRGLGTVVMGTLVTEAAAVGAHTGILVASPDGQALYTSLGWITAATVVIATNV
ncbi:GNAT family N-acetyltransferase [Saccharothrix variisporea]|uniref:Acetyltransferase (GNAT) family protein n=1 Tax=Saccharothrix variisporea TaxID=543527 RepID=A0A495X3S2_9PSEU|nr:GNAT family N-acetyltransferase [Saccharothrix variisporea]RKT68159.1 acetyltransferase (GNAT) family protein [Saccharothrix variisporea]